MPRRPRLSGPLNSWEHDDHVGVHSMGVGRSDDFWGTNPGNASAAYFTLVNPSDPTQIKNLTIRYHALLRSKTSPQGIVENEAALMKVMLVKYSEHNFSSTSNLIVPLSEEKELGRDKAFTVYRQSTRWVTGWGQFVDFHLPQGCNIADDERLMLVAFGLYLTNGMEIRGHAYSDWIQRTWGE